MLTRREVLPITVSAGATTVTVTISGSHAESAALTTDLVRITATSACYVDFGAAPVADNTKMYVPANTPEYFRWTSGNKVSVLQVSGGGTLYVTY